MDVNSGVSPLATITCAATFVTGTPAQRNSYLKYCVTVNGNIVSFQSPSVVDQIAQGGFAEGYGLCDTTTGVSYFDYAVSDSGNWNPSVPLGHTATMIKIGRTTADGAWSLTQTITIVGGPSPYAKVASALKNNSAIRKTAYLVRYADVDPADASSNGFAETFDSTAFSAWGYESLNSGRPPYGLKITELGNIVPASMPWAFDGISQNTSSGPNPCNPFGNYAGLATGIDGSVEMYWGMILNAHQTGTVTAKYEMF
jgi:hypothetical protein